MPATVQATDLDAIETAFITAILAIEPRWQRGSETRWKLYRKEREPGISARLFRIEWSAGRHTPGGYMGPNMVDTEVQCDVWTDYGGVPADEADKMLEDDHYQLRDVLNRLVDPVTPGLWWVESEGPPSEGPASEPDQLQIAHTFTVRYMKARA